MRRCPLIDALHPEVARQREFQLQLRQAHKRESSSGSTGAKGVKETATGLVPPPTTTKRGKGYQDAVTATSSFAAAARTAADTAPDGEMRKTATKNHRAAASATGTAAGNTQVRRRSRSRWSEAAPLPKPPPPSRKSARQPPPSAGSRAAASGEGSATISRTAADDGSDVASRGTSLTARQVGTALCCRAPLADLRGSPVSLSATRFANLSLFYRNSLPFQYPRARNVDLWLAWIFGLGFRQERNNLTAICCQ